RISVWRRAEYQRREVQLRRLRPPGLCRTRDCRRPHAWTGLRVEGWLGAQCTFARDGLSAAGDADHGVDGYHSDLRISAAAPVRTSLWGNDITPCGLRRHYLARSAAGGLYAIAVLAT